MINIIEFIIIFLLLSVAGGLVITSTVCLFYTITFLQGVNIMGMLLVVSHGIKNHLKYVEEL